MAVPDFQSFFKPLLEIAADGQEHSMKEARETIAKSMNISGEDLKELLPSGTQTKLLEHQKRPCSRNARES